MIKSLENIASKVEATKQLLCSEEATKMALIVPFITALGYDCTDPSEVIPEMECHLTRQKGDRVDYAISINGTISIIIECKHWDQNLSLHISQLEKYFAASDARLAILTNGIEYQFFTDNVKKNIMDKTPFFQCNITHLSDRDFAWLKLFSKQSFNQNIISSFASRDFDYNTIRNIVKSEVLAPSKDFIKFVYSKTGNSTRFSDSKEQYYRDMIISAIQGNDMYVEMNTTDEYVLYDDRQEVMNKLKPIFLSLGVYEADIIFEHQKSYSRISVYKYWMWVVRIYGTGDWSKVYISFLDINELKGEVSKTKITKESDLSIYSKDIKNILIAIKDKWGHLN